MKLETRLYRAVRPICTAFFRLFFRPTIIGMEQIPKSGRMVLAGNHTHYLDCILLMSSTKRSIHFLAKQELWRGFLKIIFSHMGLIPVDRKKKNHGAIEKAECYLNQEQLIGIFPEGTIEKEKGTILPFKMGALKMAKDTESPILPFAIIGHYKLFRKDITLLFGAPFFVSDQLETEKEQFQNKIQTLMRGDL